MARLKLDIKNKDLQRFKAIIYARHDEESLTNKGDYNDYQS